MPEENRESSSSKNVKINWKTRSLLCFPNSISSYDNVLVHSYIYRQFSEFFAGFSNH